MDTASILTVLQRPGDGARSASVCHELSLPSALESNGPEFVAESVRRWIAAVGARTAFI